MDRILIIGNSGAGKSWLAARLKELLGSPVHHLDDVFWEPGGFVRERPIDEVRADVLRIAGEPRWILEGVFGDLIEPILHRCSYLIFLDKDWAECYSALLERGIQPERHASVEDAKRSFDTLVHWASQYWTRSNGRSFIGHSMLFERFPGPKASIRARALTDEFLARFRVTAR